MFGYSSLLSYLGHLYSFDICKAAVTKSETKEDATESYAVQQLNPMEGFKRISIRIRIDMVYVRVNHRLSVVCFYSSGGIQVDVPHRLEREMHPSPVQTTHIHLGTHVLGRCNSPAPRSIW